MFKIYEQDQKSKITPDLESHNRKSKQDREDEGQNSELRTQKRYPLLSRTEDWRGNRGERKKRSEAVTGEKERAKSKKSLSCVAARSGFRGGVLVTKCSASKEELKSAKEDIKELLDPILVYRRS
ncbi:hypothetical protein Droror1_Dr00008086 [Drosera rotundifolia]